MNPCAHCYDYHGSTDGPCKPYSGSPDTCINQAGTYYCSTSPDVYDKCFSAIGNVAFHFNSCIPEFNIFVIVYYVLTHVYCSVLGIRFVSVEVDSLCVDGGNVQVGNENDCKKEAERKGLEYVKVNTRSDRPKGCYERGKVYFNNHSIGSRSVDATPICMMPGKFRCRKVNYYTQIFYAIYDFSSVQI